MTTDELFTHNLIELRKASGKSQLQVAVDLNVKRNTYHHWENKGFTPKIDMLVKICRYFEISIQDMLTTKVSIEEVEK